MFIFGRGVDDGNNGDIIMELEKEINQLQKDILQYKTTQATQGDSSNFYCVEYKPGWYIVPEDSHSYTREHTIKCVPYIDNSKAIFMAQMCPNQIGVQSSMIIGKDLCYLQNLVTWAQHGEWQSKLNNEAYAIGVPKSIMIFSNVDFYIEASYVDRVY